MRRVLPLIAAATTLLAFPASGCRPHDGYAATQSGPLAARLERDGG